MRSRTLTPLVTCFAWACLAVCPGLLPSARAQDVPYTGVVIQNQTDVRAGAANSYYRVGELDKGTPVEVVEVIVGWYKIVPPDGVYSYISKAFVDAKGDGSTGVVNTDRSKVFAADVNGPAGSYRIQAILNEGDSVKIVAEEGSHYKIVPPPNAFVYLPPGSVRRAEPIDAAPPRPVEPPEPKAVEPQPEPEPPAVAEPQPEPQPQPVAQPQPIVPDEPEPAVQTPAQPVDEPAPAPEPVVEAPAQPSQPTGPMTGDVSSDRALDQMLDTPKPVPAVELPDNFIDLENEVTKLRQLPLEDQPIDAMIAAYEAALAKGGLSQTQAFKARSRLATLRHDKPLAEGLRKIAEARKPLNPGPDTEPGKVDYTAVGRLLASSIYDGKTLPRMYRLADPATGKAVAYIRPADFAGTTAYLGQLVGVLGEAAYDPALKLKVIRVKRIDSLEPAD